MVPFYPKSFDGQEFAKGMFFEGCDFFLSKQIEMARGIAALLLMAAVVTVVECQFPFGNFFRPRRPSRPVFSRPAPPPARAPQVWSLSSCEVSCQTFNV